MLEYGRNHGHESIICNLPSGCWCPRTKGGVERIGPECWTIDYDRECKNRFPPLENKKQDMQCKYCGKQIDSIFDEYKIDKVTVCKECYYRKLGSVVENHPIGHPGL